MYKRQVLQGNIVPAGLAADIDAVHILAVFKANVDLSLIHI